MVQKPSSPLNALLQNSDGDGFQEIWAAITPQAERWNLHMSVCVQSPGGKHCWLVAWVMKKATSVWFSLTVQGVKDLSKGKQQGWLYTVNFYPQAPVPPTRFLNQHAEDAAKFWILLWRAIVFLVYSSVHCLGMFVLAVFSFRAFSDLSKFNELNKKHKWSISLVLIFGSYKSRVYLTHWQLHNSHPATLPKSSAA